VLFILAVLGLCKFVKKWHHKCVKFPRDILQHPMPYKKRNKIYLGIGDTMKQIIFIFCFFFMNFQNCYGARIELSGYEKKEFSQNGEDGVIEAIFSFIGTIDNYFVEFGVEDGAECNTRYLREKYGWHGLMMDGFHENRAINLRKEFITAEN